MKTSPQRPLVFVATRDDALEAAARTAVAENGLGILFARDIHGACKVLSEEASEIALAIIDLEMDAGGPSLLHILAGCDPRFPILGILPDEHGGEICEDVSRITAAWMSKGTTPYQLSYKVGEILRGQESARESMLVY